MSDVRRFRFSDGARGSPSQLVREVLESRGWKETAAADWALFWDVGIPDIETVRMSGPGRLLNRFPGIAGIGSKHWLHRTLSEARRHLEAYGLDTLLDVTPQTFALPEEYDAWHEAASWDPDRVWIRKPKDSSRGRDVALIESVGDVTPEMSLIVQDYVVRPRLISGRKFTLRFYVLVTSLVPLVAYVHEDGFVKLASRPFSVAPEHRADRFRHLTNPDVLRHDLQQRTSEHNMSHRAYRDRLRKEGVDAEAVFEGIRHALAAPLMAARDAMVRTQEAQAVSPICVELLGCDVTLDEQLRPLLLECNYAPSMSIEAAPGGSASTGEYRIKRRVIDEAMAIAEAGHLADVIETAPAARVARELSHRGGFSLLIPSRTSLPLTPALERVEPADVELLPMTVGASAPTWSPEVSPDVISARLDGCCVLGHLARRDLYVFNTVASAIWTGFEEGLTPGEIAQGIASVTGSDLKRVEVDVWASVTEWISVGLLLDAPKHSTRSAANVSLARIGWNGERIYRVNDVTVAVRAADQVLRHWLHPTLRSFEAPFAANVDLSVEAFSERGRFELRSSCGAVRFVANEGALAAELHLFLDRLALARRGVVFAFSATLEPGPDGTRVRIGGPVGPSRLFVRQDGGEARLAREDGADAEVVVYEWVAGEGECPYRTLPPAEGLQRLLTDSTAAPIVVDGRAARALADLASRATWRVPAC
jgi:hypothetical protein